MLVGYISNASIFSGVGHRAHRIKEELRALPTEHPRIASYLLDGTRGLLSKNGRPALWISKWPGPFGSKSISWIRLGSRLKHYLRAVDTREYDVFHLTNQSLSFLAPTWPSTVLTVHDIIEYIEPQNRESALLMRYLYRGIPHATHVICVSEYTRRSLQEVFSIPNDRISVIPNGVGSEFHPIPQFRDSIGYQERRQELRISANMGPIVLYVGSEHPRKNVPIALAAFAQLRKSFPNAVFVKVGGPGIPAGREIFLEAVDAHNLQEHIRLVPGLLEDDRLNELYNLADVCIYPSTYEGFGLPPLQAMAAGTPVVASNATSLPEVLGNSAFMHDPQDIDAFANSMHELVEDATLHQKESMRGLARATQFSWTTSASRVYQIYKKVI